MVGFTGSMYRPLFYRNLELNRKIGLTKNQQNFDANIERFFIIIGRKISGRLIIFPQWKISFPTKAPQLQCLVAPPL